MSVRSDEVIRRCVIGADSVDTVTVSVAVGHIDHNRSDAYKYGYRRQGGPMAQKKLIGPHHGTACTYRCGTWRVSEIPPVASENHSWMVLK